MIKVTYFISLGMILILTGCGQPSAYVVGTTYQPMHYTYAPGYNPPQVAYPDVPTDADTSIDSEAVIEQEHAINATNDSIAAQQQKEAAQQQVIIQQIKIQQLKIQQLKALPSP
ncbi:hypothetical protein LEAN103870_09765 [Legionella anisa]|uniref:Uncharacterized protein n=1 Tax=Legionella anisa TaxID=28082 RepID=A0AAX0WWI5_9GAMM|nr:hypothetical protein [Legionella anisa]AWN73347.1 hypothetical protein DLD14_05540 [Legionella anisa]KTC69837.1 hypothetical protein Lani_2543 [Legionella anisa]MBN5934129.1 hypothetical protein [Legionella anisa]MCW8426208.1 hypothetical protein [Legionella anisa]MCW8447870.1 hypothetical protein [Legionella anisa]